MMLWVNAERARQIGCTHQAKFMGIIPGFFNPDEGLWVSRSPILHPIEDVLAFMWVTLRRLRGEEPDFMFAVGKEI